MENEIARNTVYPEYTFNIELPKNRMLPSSTNDNDGIPTLKEGFLEGETRWEARLDTADKLDCAIAVASGVITGLIDSFFVGKFSLERANEWGSKKVNDFVKAIAKLSGYERGDLKGSIKHLEKNFQFAADGNTADFGGGLQHHLRDFSHHFSLGGLLCSLFIQFTGKAMGTDASGSLLIVDIPATHVQFLGKNFHEKIVYGTVSWAMHIASDIAGSSNNPGGGTGVPGPIVSLVKQLSSLPIFKRARPAMERGESDGLVFRELVSKIFNGTLYGVRFDFRTEFGVLYELGRQGVPVTLNQCFVRAFYFIRRLAYEIKRLKVESIADLKRIDPQDIFPFRNRAVARMSAISSGVFTAVDLSDAAIRAALLSRGQKEQFLGEFVVRINFVGIGTFAIACALDIKEVLSERKTNTEADGVDAYEKALSDLGCLELGADQVRLLQSLQRAMILQDIAATKHSRKQELKLLWLREWEAAIDKGLKERGLTSELYLLDPDVFYVEFNRLVKADPTKPWPYLLALEADLFTPYQPLGKESGKELKGLEFEEDYMLDVFCSCQIAVSKDDLKSLRKSMKKVEGFIAAKGKKNVAKFIGTAFVASVATGVAFVFAPYIAPLIAGKAVAGLSGAALTSASLAFVGGGALAAGGLGMVGGTAVIAGGGALLGTIGGTGATKIIISMTDADGFVYYESSKLLCYCKSVLLERFEDIESVKRIQASLNARIVDMEITLESLKRGGEGIYLIEGSSPEEVDESSSDSEMELDPKIQAKVLRESLKYLNRCNEELTKAISQTISKQGL